MAKRPSAERSDIVVHGASSAALEAFRGIEGVEDRSEISVGGQTLRTEGGVFALGDETIGTELNVVVVEWCHRNVFYGGKYQPGVRQGVQCFAKHRTLEGLAPPAGLATKVSEQCAGCANNAFGTSAQGKGKACKNQVYMLVLSTEDVERGDFSAIYGLTVPVTSVRKWAAYAGAVRQQRLSTAIIRTHVEIVKAGGAWEMLFTAGDPYPASTDPNVLRGLIELRDAQTTQDRLFQAPLLEGEAEKDTKKAPASARPGLGGKTGPSRTKKR